jgi:hypothetical protein
MKKNLLSLLAMCMIIFLGCETVHKTTKKGGEYLGKGAKSIGGITEGGAEGVKGKESPAENPYER